MSSKDIFGNIVGALFGALTPFCDCSTIPMTLGFLEMGIPFGAVMSLVIASPLLNPVILVMMLALTILKECDKMNKITADSTCDLSPEIIEQMDITLTPLYILVDDRTFQDGVDIRPADVFRYMEKEGKTCRTAAVNVFDYARYYQELSPRYDAVIQICIGSEFSSRPA